MESRDCATGAADAAVPAGAVADLGDWSVAGGSRESAAD